MQSSSGSGWLRHGLDSSTVSWMRRANNGATDSVVVFAQRKVNSIRTLSVMQAHSQLQADSSYNPFYSVMNIQENLQIILLKYDFFRNSQDSTASFLVSHFRRMSCTKNHKIGWFLTELFKQNKMGRFYSVCCSCTVTSVSNTSTSVNDNTSSVRCTITTHLLTAIQSQIHNL